MKDGGVIILRFFCLYLNFKVLFGDFFSIIGTNRKLKGIPLL